MQKLSVLLLGFTAGLAVLPSPALPQPAAPGATNAYSAWSQGPPADPGFFPIAVWLQDPKNAPRYQAAGINVFVGLWRGPTAEQLALLKAADMRVICGQSERSLAFKDNPIIIAWMHGDEPDNAQSLSSGKGYGPPITPEVIVRDYQQMRATDPARPVLLNLGQGVAYDNYIGRGVRRNHPEDYPAYAKGADIVSFDIYPVVHDKAEIAGKLEYVPYGVQRLTQWTSGLKPVWNCIECTRISNLEAKPAPHQVRSEVWMSLIHGSRGLIYFVHQFKPVFREAALLDDAAMLAEVTAINRQIHELAPVLNSPSLPDLATAKSSEPEVPLALLVKRHKDATYLFAAAMRNRPASGTFTLRGPPAAASVEVLGEGRTLSLSNGQFTDSFAGYEVHLYRIQQR